MKNIKRIEIFDIMRAFCMVWIVIFWHGKLLNSNSPIGYYVTIGVLAMFTFISGYLSGMGNAEKALYYYRKKFIRFYPIFILSCLSLYGMHLLDSSFQFIKTPFQMFCSMTGLACFMGNMPLTVWYFDMLIIFYLMTPWICKCASVKSQIILCAFLYILLQCGYAWGGVDNRLLVYFPYYFGALIWCRQDRKHHRLKEQHPCALGFSVLSVIILLYLSSKIQNTIWFQMIIALPVCIIGTELSKFVENAYFIKKVCRYISTASLFAYFFHRQFMGISMLIIQRYTKRNTGRFLYSVLGIIFIIICYYAQTAYDRVFKNK